MTRISLFGIIFIAGVNLGFAQNYSKLDDPSDSLRTGITNLKKNQSDTSQYSKLDFVRKKLKYKIDSLNSLKLPTAQYTRLLDSIQKYPAKTVKGTQAQISVLQKKISQPLTDLKKSVAKTGNKITSKLNEVNKNIDSDISKGTDLKSANIPNPQLQTNQVANLNTSGITNANQLTTLENNSGISQKITSVEKDASQIDNFPKQELNQLKNQGELGDLQKEVKEVNQVSSQASGYVTQLNDLAKGDIDKEKIAKAAETEAARLSGENAIQNQVKPIDQYKSDLQKANDPKAMKKLAEQQIQKEVINHFAGREKVLESALAKLDKTKLKYPSSKEINELTKGVNNEMRGKPFIERIVPGIVMQVQTKKDVLIDFNPLVGYRISHKWTSGIGWVERVDFNKFLSTNTLGRIYGPRFFTEVKWKKGISVRGEVEHVNMFVPSSIAGPPQTDANRQWVYGFFGGIKKEYGIGKHIRGNFQVLYNINDYIYKSNPYVNKISMRFGFEFPMKRKGKVK